MQKDIIASATNTMIAHFVFTTGTLTMKVSGRYVA